MTLRLKIYDNGDHTCVVWLPEDDQPIAGCRGFAIQRQISNRTKPDEKDCYLSSFVGFKDGDARPTPDQGWKWPIQRYLWWDYDVRSGDKVRYRVVPVVGSYQRNQLSLDESLASPWSSVLTVTSMDGRSIAAYFNRGIIASQWVSRALQAEAAGAKAGLGKAAAARRVEARVTRRRSGKAKRGRSAKRTTARAVKGRPARSAGAKRRTAVTTKPAPSAKGRRTSVQGKPAPGGTRGGTGGPGGAPGAELKALIAKKGDPLRDALGGLLKEELLALLSDAKANNETIYAALYELNDPELLDGLKALGPRCNLILGNGAFKPPQKDENAQVRQQLRQTSQIKLYDRIVSSGHFAHNKFVVFCDSSGAAERVLSGSTNWTMTGLCTQANNGIVIEDKAVAGAYLAQWRNLQQAGNDFPSSLIAKNSQPKDFSVDGAKVSVWFTPTQHAEDIEQARQLIQQAKDGILFLFFNPGRFAEDDSRATLLQSILERHQSGSQYFNDKLYIRGVVNQEIPGLTEPGGQAPNHPLDPTAPTSPVSVYDGGREPPVRMDKDVLVPAAIKAKYAGWQTEVLSLGVMVHSKVVVLDPFGQNPVVMTGSHNLGLKASSKNDDNLVIVQGNGLLAQAFALNIIAIYQEYRWRHYVAQKGGDPAAWRGLQDDDQWQQGHLKNEQEELAFWMGDG